MKFLIYTSTYLSDCLLHLNTRRSVFPSSKRLAFELGSSKDRDGVARAIFLSALPASVGKPLLPGHSRKTPLGSKCSSTYPSQSDNEALVPQVPAVNVKNPSFLKLEFYIQVLTWLHELTGTNYWNYFNLPSPS